MKHRLPWCPARSDRSDQLQSYVVPVGCTLGTGKEARLLITPTGSRTGGRRPNSGWGWGAPRCYREAQTPCGPQTRPCLRPGIRAFAAVPDTVSVGWRAPAGIRNQSPSSESVQLFRESKCGFSRKESDRIGRGDGHRGNLGSAARTQLRSRLLGVFPEPCRQGGMLPSLTCLWP